MADDPHKVADAPLPYPPHDPRPAARNADGSVIDGPPAATPPPMPKPAAKPAPPATASTSKEN